MTSTKWIWREENWKQRRFMQTLQRSRYDAPVCWFTSINHSLPQMSKFSLEVMNMHNDLRALHGVGPLTLSEEVIIWNHSKTISDPEWKYKKTVSIHLVERSSTKDGWGNGWEEQDCPDNHNPGSAGSQHFGILDLCYLHYGGRETWTERQDYTFLNFFPAFCHGGGWVVVQWGGLPRLPLGESELQIW